MTIHDSIIPPLTDSGITDHQLSEMREVQAQKYMRSIEALKLYEPTEIQDKYHACMKKEAVFHAGNQVGKSLAGFVEDARAVTGQDPYNKYPKENGTLVCLGMDEAHIGRVIHKYLFRSGSFNIIKDLKTGKWRTYKPWVESDLARKDEAKPAPPLIPQRYIKNMAWRKRGHNIFEIAEMHNGWTIYALGSKGDPAAGFQADLVHIDEDLERPEWYDEMIARLTMREGRLRWTSLPYVKNDALINLIAREGEDDVEIVKATIFDNPFMPKASREKNIAAWKAKGDDEYRRRALGELVIDSFLMYPAFHPDIHNAIKFDEPRTNVQEILTKRNGEPPEDWCRYMIVDPGHAVCAVTFWAVPPPSFGDYKICYKELYMRQCDAKMFGENIRWATEGGVFQEFIMDMHGGRLRDLGSGRQPHEQYSDELRKHKVKSVATQYNWTAASDDVTGREMALRSWLTTQSNGHPTVMFVMNRCPNTAKEFTRFWKQRDGKGFVLDKANRRGACHAVETCEYAAAHGLEYKKPPYRAKVMTNVDHIMAAREARARKANRGKKQKKFITLGPCGDEK